MATWFRFLLFVAAFTVSALTLIAICSSGDAEFPVGVGAVRYWRKALTVWQKQPSSAKLIWGCSNLDRGVSLTFDDGPSTYTGALLDVLRDTGVKATFFVCGSPAAAMPDLIRRMAAEGHEVGSHTWGHRNLTDIMASGDLVEMDKQIIDTETVILNLTGRRPTLLRPPYGAVNKAVLDYLTARGYSVVMWSGGCIDWFYHDFEHLEEQIYVNGMADAGALLCFHDNPWAENMVSHMAEFVRLLRVASPQTTINPQGRPIISMEQCLSQPK